MRMKIRHCALMLAMSLIGGGVALAFWSNWGTASSQIQMDRPNYLVAAQYPSPFLTAFKRVTPDQGAQTFLTGIGWITWGNVTRNHESQVDNPFNADSSLFAVDNAGASGLNKVYIATNTWEPSLACQMSGKDTRWHPYYPTVRVATSTSTTLDFIDIGTCQSFKTYTIPSSPTFLITPGTGFTGEGTPALPDSGSSTIYVALADTTRGLVRLVKLEYPGNASWGVPVDVETSCGLDSCSIAHVNVTPSARFVLVRYAGFDIPRIYRVNSDLSLTASDYSGTQSAQCTKYQNDNLTIHYEMGFIWPIGHEDTATNLLDAFSPHHDVAVGKNQCGAPDKGFRTLDGTNNSQDIATTPTDPHVTSQVMQVDLDNGNIAPLTFYACVGPDETDCAGVYKDIPGKVVEYDLGHVSLRGAKSFWMPGMAVLTYTQTDQWGGAGRIGKQEIVLAKLRSATSPEMAFTRIMHGHSKNVSGNDASQPKAIPSAGGTLLAFGSNWCLDTNQNGNCPSDTQINAYTLSLTDQVPSGGWSGGGSGGGDCGCQGRICCK